MICKYFFLFCGLPFYSVDSFFWCKQNFIFMKSNLSIFSFVACAFGVISKKSLPKPMLWSFCLMFSSKSFIALHLGLWSILSQFCIWCKVRVQFHSFACGYPVLLAPFVEKIMPLNIHSKTKLSVSLRNFLSEAVKTTSFIKSPSLATHCVNILCDQLGSTHRILWCVLNTVVLELQAKLAPVFMNMVFTWKNNVMDKLGIFKLGCSADIFPKMKEVSLWLQGKKLTVLSIILLINFESSNKN